MHQGQSAASPCDQGQEAGGVLASPDVVHQAGARLEGTLRDLRPGGIDADPCLGDALAQPPQDREHAPELLLRLHRLAARTGGLTAHVDHVRSVAHHGDRGRNRRVDIGQEATVGEGVRGHVHHAHHPRPVQRGEQVHGLPHRRRGALMSARAVSVVEPVPSANCNV